jgi:hypothetical protein
VRTVRLPGREVNLQRARLWQDLGTNSALFDVTLQAADRAVPCNRQALRTTCLCEDDTGTHGRNLLHPALPSKSYGRACCAHCCRGRALR